jgi:phage baseplate assembly protein W
MAYVFDNINNQQLTQFNIYGIGITQNTQVVSTISNVNEIAKQNLRTLINTKLGERYMLPTYGTNLHTMLFQQNNDTTKDDIQEILTRDISYWLPYININEIVVITPDDDPSLTNEIKITLNYSVNGFNTDSLIIVADESGILIT